MNTGPLNQFPDDARLWIFASREPVGADKAEALLSRVDRFLDRWHAHGAAVVGARDWRHDRFLLIASDERATGVSGCSIDSLYATLKEAQAELGVDLLDSAPIWYRDGDGEIRCVARGEFRELGRAREVDGETTVFDNTASSVGALKNDGWERAMKDSWHGKLNA